MKKKNINGIERVILLAIAFFIFTNAINAQELIWDVQINSEKVNSQEKQVFQKLQTGIQQFLNTQTWTEDEFGENEKIRCNLSIILDGESTINNIRGTAQVQSLRPTYGTDYETTLLNFFDRKWQFEYNINDPLIFSENTYSTELTSLLAYFSYIILGLDYDSFSKLGGTPYYERALNILNNAQANNGPGWGSIGGKSDTRDRYWLIDNLNSGQFVPFREAMYEYHRLGLDLIEDKPKEARQSIYSALQKIENVQKIVPFSVTISSFLDTKSSELLNMYSFGDKQVGTDALELLIRIDPTNADQYRKAISQP